MTPTQRAICRAGEELFGLSASKAAALLERSQNPAEALLGSGLLTEAQLDRVLETAYGRVAAEGDRLFRGAQGGEQPEADDLAPAIAADDAHTPGLRALLDRLRDIVSGEVHVSLPVVEVVREVAVPGFAPAPSPPPSPARPRTPGPPAPAGQPRTAEPLAKRGRGTIEAIPQHELEGPQTIDFVMGVEKEQELEDGPTLVADKARITDREAQERLADSAFEAWAQSKGIGADTMAAARASGDNLAQALVDMGRLAMEDAAAALEGDDHLRCEACGAEFSLGPLLIPFGRRQPCPRCNNELTAINPDATISVPVSSTGIPGYASGTTPPPYAGALDEESRTLAKASDRLPRTRANSTSPAIEAGGMSNYEILGELARGGMGIVYKARQKGLGRIVCLKVMRGAGMASADDRRRFLREAEASARLNHPGIVPVHEVGEHDGQCFFSMDFIDGDELGRWAKKEHPPIRDLVTIMVEVCEAIHYAHLRGIIHRDLKPANVMIDQQQKPHVMDFGIAKRLDASDDSKRGPLTQEGEIMGTPHYMAPEQAEGKVSEVDVRSDVYALGVICYELFTGKRPFQDENILRLIKLVVHAEPTSLRVVRPDLDMDLETIVLKAMDKEKARRYQSAVELGLELKRWLDGEAIEARRASNWYRLQKWAKRNRGFATAVAVFMGLLLLVIGLFVTKEVGDYVRHQRALAQLIERGQLDRQAGRLREAFTSFGEAVYMDPGNRLARDGYVDTGLLIADALFAENAPGRAEEVLRQLHFVEGRAEDVDAALAKAGALRRKAVEIGVARQRRYVDATRATLKALDALPPDHVLSSEEARDYVVTLVRHHDPETIKLLRARLHAEGDRTRRVVSRALGWIADPTAVPELATLLDMEEDLAVEAAEALGQIGGQQAWDALRAARAARSVSFSDRTQRALRRIANSLEAAPESMILRAHPELSKLEPSDPKRIREVRILRFFLSADRLRLAGDHTAAVSAYGQALLLAPEALEGYLGRGLSLMALGRLPEAEADLERVVRAEGATLGPALLNRAEVRRRQGRHEAALEDLASLLRADPSRADAHLARARILLASGKLELAHEDLDAALRLRGDYADAIASRAEAHLLESKHDEALSDANRALELRPSHPEMLLVRARVRLARGDLVECRSDATLAASLRPGIAEAYRLQASAWQRAGKVEEALAALGAGLAATRQPRLRLERVLVLLGAKREREALVELEPLLRDRQTPEELRLDALGLRGVAHVRMGEPRAALPDLRRVVAAAPESAAAHYNLACALAQAGETTEALRVLQEAVGLGFPSDELRADPDLRPLHGQEAFEQLAKEP